MFKVAGVAVIVGLIAGWNAHSIKVDADTAKALKAAQEQFEADMAQLEADMQNSENERLRLSAELNAARSNVRTVIRETVREVPKYVQDSTPECDRSLSPDFVRLYNRSIGVSDASSARTAASAGGEELAASGSPEPLRLAGGNADRP